MNNEKSKKKLDKTLKIGNLLKFLGMIHSPDLFVYHLSFIGCPFMPIFCGQYFSSSSPRTDSESIKSFETMKKTTN